MCLIWKLVLKKKFSCLSPDPQNQKLAGGGGDGPQKSVVSKALQVILMNAKLREPMH